MIKLLRRLQKKGFTLIELLVVIAIIATLAAILTPAVSNALLKGNVTQMLNNGKQLYTVMFAEEMSNPLGLSSSSSSAEWPKSTGPYTDSNNFFTNITGNTAFGINEAFFAGKGITPARSPAEFTTAGQLRNAWCITLDIASGASAGTPVFFTQNIDLTSGKRLNQFSGLSTVDNALPFREKAAIVVAYGGSAYSLDKSTATLSNFFFSGSTVSNQVLYPIGGIR